MRQGPSLRIWTAFVLRDSRAAQLVEFAVSLPLLVVFVVGIFDFSGAFTLKQKLTNVARDAARAAASDPITDLSSANPISINDAFWVVDNYLKSNRIDDCGVTYGSGVPTRPTWTFSANGGSCVGTGLIITINRGYYFPATTASQPPSVNCTPQSATGATAVVATCVSIQYAYSWRFGRAASLLGGSAVLPASISATAVAMNED